MHIKQPKQQKFLVKSLPLVFIKPKFDSGQKLVTKKHNGDFETINCCILVI